MPNAIKMLKAAEKAATTRTTPVEAEAIKLWLPSDIPSDKRAIGFKPSVFPTEVALRRSQCSTALVTLRARLHAKGYLIRFRNSNLVGQQKTTKARGLIDDMSRKITSSKVKYQWG